MSPALRRAAHRRRDRLRRAVRARPVPRGAAALGGARDRRRHRRRPVRARLGRGRRAGRGARARSAWPSCCSSPAWRSSSTTCAGASCGWPRRLASPVVRDRACVRRRSALKAAGLVETPLLVAIILVATSLGRDHPGAQGRRARSRRRSGSWCRGRLDRRLRRDHPAVAVLLRRGRRRRDAACCSAACSAVGAGRALRRSAAPSARRGRGRTSRACRTRPRRSACAAPSCC